MIHPQCDELRAALTETRGGILMLFILSAVLNVLLLGGSIFMMVVYDSVLPSRSVPTLFGLVAMVLIVYTFQAAFEILRSRILADMGANLTDRISPRVQQSISFLALRGTSGDSDGLSPMRNLDTIRQFLAGPGPGAIMDAPWVIFFLVVLTLLHPWLGVTALVGALVMVGLTALAARRTRAPTEVVVSLSGHRYAMADETRRHIELIHSMGMGNRLRERWNGLNDRLVAAQDDLGGTSSLLGGLARVFRMFLQSVVLAVGALLVIDDKASGGVIFASSILSARALAPIDQVVGQWKSFAAARVAWGRLSRVLQMVPANAVPALDLPAPTRSLVVEQLFTGPPGTQQMTVQGVTFSLKAGEALGVIGGSAAGKTSLIRAILGLWLPVRGSVRLDNAELGQWTPDRLGPHVGYLPQSVELLTGTVAENIARFAEPLESNKVIAAATAADVHDLIVHLPNGYDTQVGANGAQLSAGQRQRLALARALYGDPFLVVLDEPNSNLDAAGEVALNRAIGTVRARGGLAIVVAHRPAAIKMCTHVLIMRDGRPEAFGTKDEVLARLAQSANQSTSRAGATDTASSPPVISRVIGRVA